MEATSDTIKYCPERLEELFEHTRKQFPQHPDKLVREIIKMYLENTEDFDTAMEGFKAEVLDKFTVDDDGYINLDKVHVIKAGTKEHQEIVEKIARNVAERTAPTDPEQPSGSGPTPEDAPKAAQAVLEVREQDGGEQ